MRFTLRQLEVFLAVARFENVSRAARFLAMSQSSVSASLSEFEGQFGVQFFDRIGKRLELNALGRSIRERAEALEEHAKEFEDHLARRDDVGLLRVGATLTIGNYLIVPVIAQFVREHEGARATLHVANTAEIARMVKNFELDVGMVEGELQVPELVVSRFHDDELVVFCSPRHPFAKKRRLNDEDLKSARWIVREPGSGTRQAFESAMKGILSELHLELELQHTEGIKRAVEAGLGVGCISRVALETEFRFGSLVPCAVPGRNFRRHFYVVLHEKKFRSRGVEAWLELCQRFVGDKTRADL
jgi:DNA-binding transcriptional LysR family regulator